ncbi:MAG: class I SAM-dependent methyltransferase, partial [Crocinitomicaceae bacterium]|nr:class I SAM-dependent methyltransferase [Crocinitomicaceae bacterium]
MFGENFEKNLLNRFNEENLLEAKSFLSHYLEFKDFSGKTFLDAGCGSGVFSIVAHQMGAKVTTFDIEEEALNNLEILKTRFHIEPNQIKSFISDILDVNTLTSLGQFDLVMCWGVVHHTGNLWQAIDNVSKCVKPDGLIHLGIYNTADNFGFYPDGRFGTSLFWKKVKRFYSNRATWFQNVIDFFAFLGIFFIYLLSFNNPIKKLKENERRGMSWQSDLKDWLIGYPYEYASPEEVFNFMKERGFTLIKLKT